MFKIPWLWSPAGEADTAGESAVNNSSGLSSAETGQFDTEPGVPCATLGEVVQAAGAFAIVQGAFNWITDSYARLAEWTASANRVASFLLALDQIDLPERPPNSGMIAAIRDNEPTA